MSESAKYVDNFWGQNGLEDTGAYPGFTALAKRVTEGKNTIKAFDDILAKRAEMEKAYGHALIKMSESAAKAKTESNGDMKEAWESLVVGLKKTGLAHLELGKHLTHDLGPKYKEFKTEHSAKRKVTMKSLTNLHNAREKAYANWLKAKTNYDTKCKESEDAEKAAANPPEDAKLAEKVKNTAFKAQQSKEKAEYQYKQAVANVEAIRAEFETKFTEACDTVEEFDQERLDRMRRDMWVYSNMGSIAAVVDDNANEEIRASLEKVDPEKDMAVFVSQNATGSVRPVPVSFVAYGEKDTRQEAAGTGSSAVAAPHDAEEDSDAPVHDAPEEFEQEEVEQEEVEQEEEESADNDTQPHSEGGIVHPESNNETEFTTDKYVVVIPYQAQVKPELNLEVGDEVEVENRDEDPWWFGKVRGTEGVFHKGYLEPRP